MGQANRLTHPDVSEVGRTPPGRHPQDALPQGREGGPAALRDRLRARREHTLEEIGQEFDVTRERIRQIEAKALRQLRAPERARRLRALMAAR